MDERAQKMLRDAGVLDRVERIEAQMIELSKLPPAKSEAKVAQIPEHPSGLCQDPECVDCVETSNELVRAGYEQAGADLRELLILGGGDELRERVQGLIALGQERKNALSGARQHAAR